MLASSHAPLERNIRLYYAFRLLREFQIWIPVWVVYLTIDRGISLSQFSVAEGLFLLALTLLEVPTGAVADRWGRKFSLALGAASMGIALTLFALADSYAILLASFMIWAIAETLMSGADLALLYDSLKVMNREDEYERHAGRGEAALWLGAGVATAIGAPIAQVLSAQHTIFIGAATMGVTAAFALAMHEPPRSADDDDESDPAASYLRGMTRAFHVSWSIPTVRYMILFGGALVATTSATGYLIQPFLLRQDLELGLTFSLLQVPEMAMGVLGAALAYRIASSIGVQRFFALILVVAVALYSGLATVDFIGAIAFFYGLTWAHSAIAPVATGYLNRRIPSRQRATILSLQSLAFGLMLAPLVPLVGFTVDHRSLAQAFALSAAFAGVSGIVTGWLWLRAHRAEELSRPDEPGSAFGPPSVIRAPLATRPRDPD